MVIISGKIPMNKKEEVAIIITTEHLPNWPKTLVGHVSIIRTSENVVYPTSCTDVIYARIMSLLDMFSLITIIAHTASTPLLLNYPLKTNRK